MCKSFFAVFRLPKKLEGIKRKVKKMMDQRGGCCIARYAGGCAYDISKVDRIMLSFRPIAPKPASTDGSVFSGGSSSSSATAENASPSVKTGRGKRRAQAAKDGGTTSNMNRRNSGRKRKSSPENADSGGSVPSGVKEIKTLALLPESPDVLASKKRLPLLQNEWICGGILSPAADPAEVVGRRAVVESWVKVECVTDTWVVGCYGYGGTWGRTDEEKVRGLDLDTCPGFVSDGLNRVRWTNAAYMRMMASETGVAVLVVVEEGVSLPVGCPGFTCRVRVVTCGSSQTVPCDVWRMECGGFAWRLDTTAALCLGR